MIRCLILVAVVALPSCTAVHYVKRDDCWIRETKPWHGVVQEDLGPCTRPAPEWSEDRFTRLMQECVAQSDYRWQHLALDAWKRGEPIPERHGEAEAEACAEQASLAVLSENETMKVRNEVMQERVDEVVGDRERLQDHNEHLANVLGEAAQKPAGSAVATATAHGEGTTRNNNDSSTQSSTNSSTDSSTETVHRSGHAPAPPASTPPRLRLGSTKPVDGPQPTTTPASAPKPVKEKDAQTPPLQTVIPAADENPRAAPPDCPP